jgi:hypothetical protein
MLPTLPELDKDRLGVVLLYGGVEAFFAVLDVLLKRVLKGLGVGVGSGSGDVGIEETVLFSGGGAWLVPWSVGASTTGGRAAAGFGAATLLGKVVVVPGASRV